MAGGRGRHVQAGKDRGRRFFLKAAILWGPCRVAGPIPSGGVVKDLRAVPSAVQIVTDMDGALPRCVDYCACAKAFPLPTGAAAESCRQNDAAGAASPGDELPHEGHTETYPEGRDDLTWRQPCTQLFGQRGTVCMQCWS